MTRRAHARSTDGSAPPDGWGAVRVDSAGSDAALRTRRSQLWNLGLARSALEIQKDERLLIDAEHEFVNPFEDKRVELTEKAAGKLIRLIQDIVTGDGRCCARHPTRSPARSGRVASPPRPGRRPRSHTWPPQGGRLSMGYLDALADTIVSIGDLQSGRGRPTGR